MGPATGAPDRTNPPSRSIIQISRAPFKHDTVDQSADLELVAGDRIALWATALPSPSGCAYPETLPQAVASDEDEQSADSRLLLQCARSAAPAECGSAQEIGAMH